MPELVTLRPFLAVDALAAARKEPEGGECSYYQDKLRTYGPSINDLVGGMLAIAKEGVICVQDLRRYDAPLLARLRRTH